MFSANKEVIELIMVELNVAELTEVKLAFTALYRYENLVSLINVYFTIIKLLLLSRI